MKKFIKTFALMLTAAMIISLTACDDDGDNKANTSASSAVASEVSSEEESQESSEIISEPVSSEESPEVSEAEAADGEETEIPFEIKELTDSNEEKDVVEFLKEKYGVKDETTGFEMIYSVAGTIEYQSEPYYFVYVRWMVTDENGNALHSSRVGELLVSMDKTQIYNAFANGDTVTVYPKTSQEALAPAEGDNAVENTEDSSPVEISADIKDITEDERKSVEQFMVEKHGEKSEGNGFEMSYTVSGTVEYNSAEYYLVTMRWLVQDESGNPSHLSRLGEVLVSKDMKTEYQADMSGDTLTVYPSSVKRY